MQTAFPLLGSATRPTYFHPVADMALCQSITHAVYLALRHAQMTQEEAAERLAVTGGYMSMLMTGKRHWSEDKIRRLMTITGSMAPLQWLCASVGAQLYADPVETRKAALRAELQSLEKAA